MKKLVNYMKKHKIEMLILSIFVFAVPLLVVHLLYKIDCEITWLQSEWTAGDVLTYIAGFESFIGTVSLGFLALWQNQQIQEQYIESQEPLLSMNLIDENSILYLVIENTGGEEAKDISIKVLNICNNGHHNELCLDGLFGTVFELYPKEKVKGRIAFSGANAVTEICPQIKIKVSYIRSDLNRVKEYERTVTYSNVLWNNKSADEDIENEKIASDIDKIARASVRIANYLDGHQVAKFDELDILAHRSLRNDLVGAIVTRQEIPIFDRPQTIDECFEKKMSKNLVRDRTFGKEGN